MSGPTADEWSAWAYLSRVAEPPCSSLGALVTEVGPVEAAERVRRGAVDARLADLTEARRGVDRAAADLELVHRLGGRLLVPTDDEWPVDQFRAGADGPPAPMVLWLIGPEALSDVAARSCALVGTRAATAYGEHVTADLATGLAEAGVAVVSGGAYGIDGVAHRATLAAEGRTVAVLASGIDVPYPAGHSALLHRIGTHGLVVTEYPPGTRPGRHRFLKRNRLVAALGGATVVVEAGLRSGAANTAWWAGQWGRPVAAVPGPVTSAASAGAHALLRDGACVVTRAAEIVELVGRIGELADEPAHPATPLDGLTERQSLVYDALPSRGSVSVDELAVAAGLPAVQLLAPLAALELSGLARRSEGRWQLVRR